jgi:hypothetical protein
MKILALRPKWTKQGSVMVGALVLMLIMAFIMVAALTASKQDTHQSSRTVFAVQARYLAEGALERAKIDYLGQIAATNFLNSSFNTVGELYSNIENRFNVGSKRIPGTMDSSSIDWRDSSFTTLAAWDFTSDPALDIPGVDDWSFIPGEDPVGDARVYISRAAVDEDGDAANNLVGSYEVTLTGWGGVGTDFLPVDSVTSKTYRHGLAYPRIFDFIYLGSSLSDCSMCHLKIMGDIGQVNALDPFEMHISFNSSRFNRLTLYGSLFTNGNFIRAARNEGTADARPKQELMMFSPGEPNQFARTRRDGTKPDQLIYAKNGPALRSSWESNPGGTANPYRDIKTLQPSLPQSWDPVKPYLLSWFEPRATTAGNSGNSRIELDLWDNNIGYVVPLASDTNDNALPWIPKVTIEAPFNGNLLRPVTYFNPYGIIGTITPPLSLIATDANNPENPYRYYPFMRARTHNDPSVPKIPYGVQDNYTETRSGTTVSARVVGADGIPDSDMNEDGTIDAADNPLRFYAAAIDRAPNRSNAIVNSSSPYLNVSASALRRPNLNRGLHGIDDFDYDTVPNIFDPDMDGDGIPESPRASSVATNLGFHVTHPDAIDNGWIVWVNTTTGEELPLTTTETNKRPQWKRGYAKLRFASWIAPFDPLPTTYWVRKGALEFDRMSWNNVPARPGVAGTPRTNWDNATARSNDLHADVENMGALSVNFRHNTTFNTNDIVVWDLNNGKGVPANQYNPDPQVVWTGAGGGAAKCWPVIRYDAPNRNSTSVNWVGNGGVGTYRRMIQDVGLSNRISRVYEFLEINPSNIAERDFGWRARVTGMASAADGRTAMQNLILGRLARNGPNPRGLVTGVFPSAALDGTGNPVLSSNPGDRSLLLVGSPQNPIRIEGQVVVRGDLVITGVVSGTGSIVAHRNVFVPNDLRYKNPPNYLLFDYERDESGDLLGLIAGGNVLVGNIIHNTTARTDIMEFVWGNMVDINSAELTGATPWNYGADGPNKTWAHHMINPVYLYDGANGGFWSAGQWIQENAGNCVDVRYNAQSMPIGGGLVKSGPTFNDARKHVNFNGDSNPSTAEDSNSIYRNFWISTPGLLPEGASRIVSMPSTYYGTYTGAWFSPDDFKMLTLRPVMNNTNWTNTLGYFTNARNFEIERNPSWPRHVEGVLYAQFGVIGGNVATVGPNFLEFRGAVVGRDIQLLSAVQNNSGDDGTLRPPQDFLGTYKVGGLYYDNRLLGSINPLGFPFSELFQGGEMSHNFLPPVVDGNRDNWYPFRFDEGYRQFAEE